MIDQEKIGGFLRDIRKEKRADLGRNSREGSVSEEICQRFCCPKCFAERHYDVSNLDCVENNLECLTRSGQLFVYAGSNPVVRSIVVFMRERKNWFDGEQTR